MKSSRLIFALMFGLLVIGGLGRHPVAQAQTPQDNFGPIEATFAQWKYPNARMDNSVGGFPQLYQGLYSSKDKFDTVWNYYWHKVKEHDQKQEQTDWNMPDGTTTQINNKGQRYESAHSKRKLAKGRVGTYLWKTETETVYIAISRSVGDTETHIDILITE